MLPFRCGSLSLKIRASASDENNGGMDISVYGLVQRYCQALPFIAPDLAPAATEVELRRSRFGACWSIFSLDPAAPEPPASAMLCRPLSLLSWSVSSPIPAHIDSCERTWQIEQILHRCRARRSRRRGKQHLVEWAAKWLTLAFKRRSKLSGGRRGSLIWTGSHEGCLCQIIRCNINVESSNSEVKHCATFKNCVIGIDCSISILLTAVKNDTSKSSSKS